MTTALQHDHLVAQFEAFRTAEAFGPEWLRTARTTAYARFLESGFPTTRDEEWKFTPVTPLTQIEWQRASAPRTTPAVEAHGMRLHAVLVNGRFSPELSSLNDLPAGVTITSLKQAMATQTLDGPSLESRHPFVSLNTAFFEDGLFVHVAPRSVIEEPILLTHINVSEGQATMVAPRILIVVGEQAQASFVESYVGTGTGSVFTTAVTEVMLGPSAVIDHVKVQQETAEAFHLASTFVHAHRASTFTSQAITFGGRIARNDISATLAGEGAEVTLNGLYVADGDTLVDTHTTIDHAFPHCPSHEVYKGILAGRARAVFNGKIIVRQDAQRTDANQNNKALLLSGDATINTKPQLEIFADDVKCTHGAAIGQLDEDGLFYLRARGISEADARNILIHAFASDVLNGVKHDGLRADLERVLVEKLHLPA